MSGKEFKFYSIQVKCRIVLYISSHWELLWKKDIKMAFGNEHLHKKCSRILPIIYEFEICVIYLNNNFHNTTWWLFCKACPSKALLTLTIQSQFQNSTKIEIKQDQTFICAWCCLTRCSIANMMTTCNNISFFCIR